MFVLYGNKKSDGIYLNETIVIDDESYDKKENETADSNELSEATEVIKENEKENVNDNATENENESESIAIPLTSDEKYKASNNFKKVDIREKKDVFCFAGDVFLSKKPRAAYDEKGLDGIIDESYLKILKNSDLNIANLECSITDNIENAEDKTFTFALPTKYVKPITEIGIDLFTMANNHSLDYGANAMLNTIKVLNDNKILHIGAGKNIEEAKRAYIKEIDGKRYAFLAASAVLPSDNWKATETRVGVFDGYDIRELCEEIKIVKPYVDKVIVYMHWGRELETVSNTWQKQYARRIVDAGADLIIGSHSHIVQEIEYYKNVPIVYSLGNFIYGGTMRDTILVTATFDYSVDKAGQLQLQIFTGISSYERVKKDRNKDEIAAKIKELQDKSSTCYIGDNGIVFTMEQVAEALKQLESSGEIN
ncbi:MAG: CapA family protein [Lachnospiraceae bacterium]|nr:CapA family protein [Lachnospiraceae bacterium]